MNPSSRFFFANEEKQSLKKTIPKDYIKPRGVKTQ